MSYKLRFKVRDYECDLQGIVNNAVYQNYLEHARHEFLLTKGIDFSLLTSERIHLVVFRAELKYKTPLLSKDDFMVTVSLQKISKLKLQFNQDIIREKDSRIILKAKITSVFLNENRRPYYPDFLDKLFIK